MSALTTTRHTACRTHIDQLGTMLDGMTITLEQAADLLTHIHFALHRNERNLTSVDIHEVACQLQNDATAFEEVAA